MSKDEPPPSDSELQARLAQYSAKLAHAAEQRGVYEERPWEPASRSSNSPEQPAQHPGPPSTSDTATTVSLGQDVRQAILQQSAAGNQPAGTTTATLSPEENRALLQRVYTTPFKSNPAAPQPPRAAPGTHPNSGDTVSLGREVRQQLEVGSAVPFAGPQVLPPPHRSGSPHSAARPPAAVPSRPSVQQPQPPRPALPTQHPRVASSHFSAERPAPAHHAASWTHALAKSAVAPSAAPAPRRKLPSSSNEYPPAAPAMLTGEATPLKPQLPLHKPPFEQAAYNKPVAKMHERMPEDRVQAEHMAAPVAETDAEIVLDWSKWPSTQARRSLSRSLATLMLLEESDVDRFMARNLGQRSQLTKNDLNRMRDVLNALADALDAGDERQSKALEAAWILLCPKS